MLTLLTSTCVFAVPAAPAGATAIQTLSFSDTSNVSDTPATSGATTGTHTYGSLNFNQFNTANGVLTGVQVSLTSTRTETTALTGTGPSGSQVKRNNADNTDTNTYLSAPGITSGTSGQPSDLSQTTSCGRNGANQPPACPRTLTSLNIATDSNFAVATANRTLYVGLGTVNVTLNSLLSALNTTSGGTWTSPKDSYTVAWAGNVSVAYSYNQHSEASFNSASTNYDSLNINFGTVLKGTSPAKQSFEIYNLLQTDPNADARMGLNFNAAGSSASGDTSAFVFDTLFGSIFQQGAGDGKTFGVRFDTSKLGTFTAVYDLAFIDQSLPGSIGQSGNSAVLTITGTVVPEPESLALVLGGLMVMGGFFGLRRTR
jgi:hypothetical protein